MSTEETKKDFEQLMEELYTNPFRLGSCQYDDIADIVGEHYLKVLELKDFEEFKLYAENNFTLINELKYNEVDNKTIFDAIKLNLIESYVGYDELDIVLNMKDEEYEDVAIEIIKLHNDGLLLTKFGEFVAEDPDWDDILKDALERINSIMAAETMQELIIEWSNTGCDLWGCAGIASAYAGFECNEQLDEFAGLNILFLIWRFKIENPFEVFDGFST